MEKIKELLSEIELGGHHGPTGLKVVNAYLPEFVKLSTEVGKDGLVIYDQLAEEEIYRGENSWAAYHDLNQKGLVWKSFEARKDLVFPIYSIHDNVFVDKVRAESIQDGKGIVSEQFTFLREGETFNEGGYEYELFHAYDHALEELNAGLEWEKESGLSLINKDLTISESNFGMNTVKRLLDDVEIPGEGLGFLPEFVEVSTHSHSEGVRIARVNVNDRSDEAEVIYEGNDVNEAFYELDKKGLVWESVTAKENSVEKVYVIHDSVFLNEERADSLQDGKDRASESYVIVREGESFQEGTFSSDYMQYDSREEALEELKVVLREEKAEKTSQLENVFKELTPIEQDYFIAINELNVHSDINIPTGEEFVILSTLSLNLSDEQIEKVDNLYEENIFVDMEYRVSETKTNAPEGMIHGDDLRDLVKELPEREEVEMSSIDKKEVVKKAARKKNNDYER